MTSFLNSVKADLTDRRLLPIVALVGVAMLAAVAYVVLGGGSSTTAPGAALRTVSPPVGPGSLTISQETPEKAVAETTDGVTAQHKGIAHNPFVPLPEPAKATASTTTAVPKTGAGSGSSGSSSASGSGSSSKGASEPPASTPSTPSTPAAPKTVYHVAILFGALPAGTTQPSTQLTPYENLKLLTPLPSAKQALIVFRGVTAGGKSATFTLVGEAILHGNGTCLPSASACQAIDLKVGQVEQLEYLPPGGETVTYELRVVSIASSKASSASVKSILRGESKAGRELLRRNGLEALPDLRDSSQVGVLVFAGHPAFGARAHAAHAHAARAHAAARQLPRG